MSLDLSAAAIALTNLGRDRKVKADKLKVDKHDTPKMCLKRIRRTKDEEEKWGKKNVRGLFSLRPSWAWLLILATEIQHQRDL